MFKTHGERRSRPSQVNARVCQRVAYVNSFILIFYMINPAVQSLGANDVRHHMPLNLLNLTAFRHRHNLIQRSFPAPIDFIGSIFPGVSPVGRSGDGRIAELTLPPADFIRWAGKDTDGDSFVFSMLAGIDLVFSASGSPAGRVAQATARDIISNAIPKVSRIDLSDITGVSNTMGTALSLFRSILLVAALFRTNGFDLPSYRAAGA